jgi:hypothetical protein
MRWLVVLALSLLAAGQPAYSANPLPERAQALFRWFDSLGLEDTSKVPLVRIHTGAMESGNADVMLGWLLEDRGAKFRAILLDGTTGEFTKVGDLLDAGHCGYAAVSLAEEAAQAKRALASHQALKTWAGAKWRWRSYDRLAIRAQFFMLARSCEQHGLAAPSADLFRAVVAFEEAGRPKGAPPLEDLLQQDFGELLSWRLQCAFRSSTATWADLLAACRQALDRCPKANPETIKLLAETFQPGLEKLIAEEADRARHEAIALDALPPAERARELVWRLRDESSGRLTRDEPWPRPFPSRPSNGSFEALCNLGMDAVPALIEELRGGHLSRSFYISTRASRAMGYAMTPPRVVGSDFMRFDTRFLATQVLDQIAGFTFFRLASTNFRAPDAYLKIAKVAEEWFAAEQAKTADAWLAGKLCAIGHLSGVLPRPLPAGHAESTSRALILAARQSPPPLMRYEIHTYLNYEKHPEVTDFFREEVVHGPSLYFRSSAASKLAMRGDTEAERVILAEWRRQIAGLSEVTRRDFGHTLPIANSEKPPWEFSPEESLLWVTKLELAAGGSAGALRVLLDQWPALPLRLREAVVIGLCGRYERDGRRPAAPADPAARVLAREILLTALQTTAPATGLDSDDDDLPCADPRICDLAAHALHQSSPKKFVFDLSAPEPVREQQRVAICNADRRESGLEEISALAPRPKVPAARASLVAAVEWEAGSAEPPAALRQKMESFKGRALPATALVEVVTAYAAHPVPGTRGLRLRVTRDGDGTGVIIRAGLTPGEGGTSGEGGEYAARQLVFRQKQDVHSDSSTMSRDEAASTKSWHDLKVAAASALASPPREPIGIRVELVCPR